MEAKALKAKSVSSSAASSTSSPEPGIDGQAAEQPTGDADGDSDGDEGDETTRVGEDNSDDEEAPLEDGIELLNLPCFGAEAKDAALLQFTEIRRKMQANITALEKHRGELAALQANAKKPPAAAS